MFSSSCHLRGQHSASSRTESAKPAVSGGLVWSPCLHTCLIKPVNVNQHISTDLCLFWQSWMESSLQRNVSSWTASYHDGEPPVLSCCSLMFRTSPRGKGVANRNKSTAPLSKTGLSGSVRVWMSLSPSEPLSFRVTYRTQIMDPSAFKNKSFPESTGWMKMEAFVTQLENKRGLTLAVVPAFLRWPVWTLIR